MDTTRIPPAGDPFYASGAAHCFACYEGWVYLGISSEENGEPSEAEVIERVPCRRCSEPR